MNFLPFDEKRYFTPGNDIPVFETEIGTIGLLICYDIFFPESSSVVDVERWP